MNRPWFASKAYGIGASTPIRWEGWAVFAGFLALFFADLRLAPPGVLRILGAAVLVAVFAAVCAWKTEGGWRWRWGGR